MTLTRTAMAVTAGVTLNKISGSMTWTKPLVQLALCPPPLLLDDDEEEEKKPSFLKRKAQARSVKQ